MLVDHIARFPNLYDLISGRNLLWFSAAEGFVTISGLLVGYIYAHKFTKQPKLVIHKLYRRAFVLYIAVISLALFFILYTHSILHDGHFTDGSIVDFVFQLLTLQYSYGWAEFLTHYVIFLLFAPIGLYLITTKRSWLLFILSGALWAMNLWNSADQTRYEFTASWQFLFFMGMIVGAHLLTINAWVRARLSAKTLKKATYGLWSLAFILFLTSSFLSYGASLISQNSSLFSGLSENINSVWHPLNAEFFSWWTDKATAAPLRIIFGIIVFWALFTFFHRFATIIHRYTYGVFLTLGKQPLFAYCFGAAIVFFIEVYIPSPARPGLEFIGNIIVTSIAIFITYSATKLFTRYLHTKSLRSPDFKESPF